MVDDLIAYVRSEDEVFLIPNAANTSAVVGLLAADAPAGTARTTANVSVMQVADVRLRPMCASLWF